MEKGGKCKIEMGVIPRVRIALVLQIRTDHDHLELTLKRLIRSTPRIDAYSIMRQSEVRSPFARLRPKTAKAITFL